MKTSHTPGIWAINSKNPYEVFAILNGGASYALPDEQMLANARLISAAPDLLAALEELERQAQDFHDWDDLVCFIDDPETRAEYEDEYKTRLMIRLAIAKARGEA